MTSLHDSITIGQQQEFIRILVAKGMDPGTFLTLLRNEELVGPWVAQAKAVLTSLPVKHQHELFVSNKQQLVNARMWWLNSIVGTKIIRDAEKQMANLKVPAEPLQAWVLYPSFNTVEQTFEYLWESIQKIHPKHWRSPELKSDAKNLRLLKGINLETYYLKWVLVDFGAHLGLTPNKVCGSESAHAELLAAVLQHPIWAKSMGTTVKGIFVPYVNLCGYQSLVGSRWLGVPSLRCKAGKLNLDVGLSNRPSPYWACPVRLGSQ